MTKIQVLFDEAVSAPPPSRLTADQVLAAARSAQRRHQNVMLVAAGVVLVLGIGVLAVAVNGAGRGGQVGAGDGSPVVWAGRGDATHLYVVRNVCGIDPRTVASGAPSDGPSDYPSGDPSAFPTDQSAQNGTAPPTQRCSELLASSDAGATWVSRGLMVVDSVQIVGPSTLIRLADSYLMAPVTHAEGPTAAAEELSTDGGATWSLMPADGPPIDALPAGGSVGFSSASGGDLAFGSGGVRVFDPSQRRYRPLTHQPKLDLSFWAVTNRSNSAVIWLIGVDRVTRRPAVGVSRDGGLTWMERDMPGALPIDDGSTATGSSGIHAVAVSSNQLASMVVGTGDTAYAMTSDSDKVPPGADLPGTQGWGWAVGYRTVDGGQTWQQLGSSVPSYSHAWLAADGRLVLVLTGRRIAGSVDASVVLVSADGQSYAVASPPGLPADPYFVDGSVAYDQHAMYISDDGWTFREAWHG